jgi:hypothetical protein
MSSTVKSIGLIAVVCVAVMYAAGRVTFLRNFIYGS